MSHTPGNREGDLSTHFFLTLMHVIVSGACVNNF